MFRSTSGAFSRPECLTVHSALHARSVLAEMTKGENRNHAHAATAAARPTHHRGSMMDPATHATTNRIKKAKGAMINPRIIFPPDSAIILTKPGRTRPSLAVRIAITVCRLGLVGPGPVILRATSWP